MSLEDYDKECREYNREHEYQEYNREYSREYKHIEYYIYDIIETTIESKGIDDKVERFIKEEFKKYKEEIERETFEKIKNVEVGIGIKLEGIKLETSLEEAVKKVGISIEEEIENIKGEIEDGIMEEMERGIAVGVREIQRELELEREKREEIKIGIRVK